MPRCIFLVAFGLVGMLAGLTSSGYGQTYTSFDVPNSTSTTASAINAAGQIAGLYADSSGNHGFLRESDGSFTSFDAPNIDPFKVSLIGVTSMNNEGQITGYFYMLDLSKYASFIRDADGTLTAVTEPPECFPSGRHLSSPIGSNIQGIAIASINNDGQSTGICGEFPPFNESFLRNADGTFVSITVDGADMTLSQAINSHGQITGYYFVPGPAGGYHCFLRQPNGKIVSFDVPGSSLSVPTAINESGEITGYPAFLRKPKGGIATFSVPSSTSTQPTAINPRGQITGTYVDSNNVNHGFLREANGCITTFDVPNATSTYPTGINARGEITGWYSDVNGVHSFIRTR